MSYSTNVPVIGDSLNSSRDRIRTNFQLIAQVEAINHIGFGLTGQGKHKFLQMPETNTISPGTPPATAINEGGLYTKEGTNPAQTNLFFRAENSGGGGGKEYQLTHVDASLSARFATFTVYDAAKPNQQGGWTFLPGGLLLNYGFVTSPANGTVITWAKPFAGAVTVQLTPLGPDNSSSRNIALTSVTAAQCVLNLSGTSSATVVYFYALGT